MQLTTTRLYCRPFALHDVDSFAELCQDPKVMQYIGNGIETHADSAKKVTQWANMLKQKKYGPLAVFEKATNNFMGFCGLMDQEVDGEQHIELGYRFDTAYWGKGYATEAAIAVRDYAFNQLEINHLISIIHINNFPSQKVANRVGLLCWKQTTFKGKDVFIFRVNALLPANDNDSWDNDQNIAPQ